MNAIAGKTAGQVDHDYVVAVMQGAADKVSQHAAPPAVPAQRKASEEAEESSGQACAKCLLVFHIANTKIVIIICFSGRKALYLQSFLGL